MTEIKLAPGDILYREGDGNDSAYLIHDGEVALFRLIDGKESYVERRGAGSIVGELSILTSRPRAVTVQAVSSCTVYKIAAEQIRGRFDKLDPVLRACVETSISFTAAFAKEQKDSVEKVPVAPGTLRNWTHLIDQFRLEADLVEGLKRGEFSLHYQPIVTMPEGKIVGIEALMRWHHPTQGAIRPDLFIEAAENTGTITLLTEFAISEGCAALDRMRRLYGAPNIFFISINVSGQDITRPDFVGFLKAAIKKHNVPPQCIKLEVTETSIVHDIDNAVENLKLIRALGCGISVDDFGTGYSNLAYLKLLPLTVLKIDRAFGGDAYENHVSRGIVRMLITLGDNLGVDVIAEGLETIDDVDTLLELGCLYAQGYYFFKPMPEAELAGVLAENCQDRDVA